MALGRFIRRQRLSTLAADEYNEVNPADWMGPGRRVAQGTQCADACVLAFAGGVLVLFDVLKPLSAGLFALTAIEIVWELSITIYAIFIGFRPTQEK